VVREGQRRHLVFPRLRDEVGETVRTVQEGVFGMDVEVYEAH